MQHSLFALAFFLFATTYLIAQTPWTFGLKAGLHFSQVDEQFDGRTLSTTAIGDDAGDILLKPQFGVWMSVPLSERVSLQPEFLWTQKAWNQQAYPPGGEVLTFDYFSIPLALTYQIRNWQLTFGPELTYLFNSYYPNGSPYQPDTRESEFINDKEFGLAANLGLQYQYQKWMFGLRASRDLNEISKTVFTDVNGEPVEGFKHYHQGMILWAGYALTQQSARD